MGTRGRAGVPKNAEILAAFLYWETLAETRRRARRRAFRGTPVTFVRTVAQPLDGVFAPCWSQQRQHALRHARRRAVAAAAAARRERQPDRPAARQRRRPAGRRRGAAYRHAARARRRQPDTAERGRQSLRRLSATPTRQRRCAASSCTTASTCRPRASTTQQKIRGFLQSAAGAARLTQIMSRGAANSTDQLTFAGAGANTATGNLFAGTLSPGSDRALGQPDDDVTASMPGADARRVRRAAHDVVALRQRLGHTACQTWSAIAFSTPVKDADDDGLIDRARDAADRAISSQGSERRRLSAAVGDGRQHRPEGSVRRNQQHAGARPAPCTDRRSTASRCRARTSMATASSPTPPATIIGRCRRR